MIFYFHFKEKEKVVRSVGSFSKNCYFSLFPFWVFRRLVKRTKKKKKDTSHHLKNTRILFWWINNWWRDVTGAGDTNDQGAAHGETQKSWEVFFCASHFKKVLQIISQSALLSYFKYKFKRSERGNRETSASPWLPVWFLTKKTVYQTVELITKTEPPPPLLAQMWCPEKWHKCWLGLQKQKKTPSEQAQVQIYSRHAVHAIICMWQQCTRNRLGWPGLTWSHRTSTWKILSSPSFFFKVKVILKRSCLSCEQKMKTAQGTNSFWANTDVTRQPFGKIDFFWLWIPWIWNIQTPSLFF